ncbi:MAG TPA: hypothetical protein VFR08_04820 [Candidatus Angelobacter sp.]|nr:hypothetical protein [Candidatus Angelobacter sp.]
MRRSNNSLRTFLVLLLAVFTAGLTASTQESANAPAPGWVVIPVDEYQQLRTRAYPADRLPEPPPVEVTLTRVDYDLHINGDLATGRATLTVDVIKDGWVRVAIPAGLLVREARLEGKPLALVPDRNKGHQLSAILAHPGRALLLLDIAMPVNASAGEETLSLPATLSGVTRASVELPRYGVELTLNGGLLSDKTESAGATKWLAYGHGNEPLTFSWRRRIEERHIQLPLRMRGSLVEAVSMSEDLTPITAEVDLSITQGSAKEARIKVPDQVTINQVTGAMVGDWEVKGGELTVSMVEPVEQSTRFVISGEIHAPREGEISVPILRLLNVERESGGVAVEVLGAGEIKEKLTRSEGLEGVDAAELGDLVANRQSPSMEAFRFRAGENQLTRSLTVNVARYEQQAVLLANIEEARYKVLMSGEGKTLVQANYAVRNNHKNFLAIKLPPGSVVWSTTLNGVPVRPGEADDHSLLLPLEKSRAGNESQAFAVQLMYLDRESAWSDKGKAHLTLPTLDIAISRTGVEFYHSPQFHVTPDPGAFRMEPYAPPLSPALNESSPRDSEKPASMPVPAKAGELESKDAAQHAALVDEFRNKVSGGRTSRSLPVAISFPTFGSSVYLVAELTAENHAPAIDLSYQKEKKEGKK